MSSPANRAAIVFILGVSTAAPFVPQPPAGWTLETGAARQEILRKEVEHVDAALTAEDREEKTRLMRESPFAFYRATARLFHRDVEKPLAASPFNGSETVTVIQGDLHIQNFGTFDDDKENVIYDVNDFDEAWTGSYLRDVWRAAVSIVLASQTPKNAADAVETFTESYLDTLQGFHGNDQEKNAELTEKDAKPPLKKFIAEVESDNSRSKLLKKWTEGRALKNKNLQPATPAQRDALEKEIPKYKDELSSGLQGKAGYFKVLAVARRTDAGLGSFGIPRFYVLIEGASPAAEDDRILEIKRQGLPSVHSHLTPAENEAPILARYPEKSQGCRVAAIQKALLANADDHLGCLSMLGASWSVRERSPFKDDLGNKLEALAKDPAAWQSLARQWGNILATDHARANLDADLVPHPGKLQEAIHRLTPERRKQLSAEVLGFALAYAKQVESDWTLFRALHKPTDN